MSVRGSVKRRFSWNDYRDWDDGQRWELIGGEAFCMSPAPSVRHQAVVGALFGQLLQHFQGKSCRPFVAPVDVKLSAEDVVQPDIMVICDRSKILDSHIEGAPDLVVEVLSPSSDRHDRVRKLRLYASHGVQEYWLVQPYPAVIEVLQLVGTNYRIAGAYTDAETLHSPTLSGLEVDLSTVFTLPVPVEKQIDEVRESAPPYDAGYLPDGSPAQTSTRAPDPNGDRPAVIGHALDDFIGDWTDAEAEEFLGEVAVFEQIDESLWQ